MTVGDKAYRVGGKLVPSPETNSTELVCDVDGTITRQRVRITKEGITLYTRDGSVEFSKPLPKYQLQGGSTGGAGDAVAPMPGVIEKVVKFLLLIFSFGIATRNCFLWMLEKKSCVLATSCALLAFGS